jgi:hypothetical protein
MQTWPRPGTPRCPRAPQPDLRPHLQRQYAGGMPTATAAPRSQVDFTGTDVFRIHNGLLAEYWLNSDVHVMVAQLARRPDEDRRPQSRRRSKLAVPSPHSTSNCRRQTLQNQ